MKEQNTGLYPPIEPRTKGHLEVGNTHEIYFEESGNPDGKPVVFVHGGPGGGSDEKHRRFFDPKVYRIVLFDQRGCGKSRPHANLDHNTTWDLVGDMEKLREHLEIEKWQVFGGSWGSTLSLSYAETHPDRVTELVLRGIFLLRQKELRWFYQEGASAIFPDAWEKYLAPIPPAEREDLMAAYRKRLVSDNADERIQAARAWSQWEGATSRLLPSPMGVFEQDEFCLAFARIENHFFVNKGFFNSENQLIGGVDTIRHIPAFIVQGRYDVVCPMETAWELHRAWPEAEFRVIEDAGHSAFEPGISRALVEATDKFGAN